MTELSIVPECYVDTRVAEILGGATGRYNHQHSCGDVANELQHRLRDKVAIGIIDEDKNKSATAEYFSEFKIIKSEKNLILKKHGVRKHYLVLICPEMEAWLMNEAMEAKLDLKDFGLPAEMKGLKRRTKRKDINKNNDFYRFIKALIKAKSPSITTLKTWLELYKNDQLDTLIKTL